MGWSRPVCGKSVVVQGGRELIHGDFSFCAYFIKPMDETHPPTGLISGIKLAAVLYNGFI
jgi:hypothetical protein